MDEAGKLKKVIRLFRRPKYQLIILVLLLAVLGGVWAHVGTRGSGGLRSAGSPQVSSKWIDYIGGEPHACAVVRGFFDLYEFHADDTVRIVYSVDSSYDAGKESYLGGPWLISYSDLLAADFINCQLVNQSSIPVDYHGNTYYYYEYIVNVSGRPYGLDTLVNQGYLHVRAADRLLSIGADPFPYCDQRITAVAVPLAANITSIYDYQPYRHLVLDGWDVYYYDTTDISNHVSIHITYISGEDAPELDWAKVEAAR